jgi:diaminopimelate epimerase
MHLFFVHFGCGIIIVMKTIKLTKMQGIGNDFVIIDYPEYEKTNLSMSELAKKVCDRNFGIGADGMIIPNLSPENKEADIGWFFYQSDGSTAQMCGNGMRCFAKYVHDKNLVNSNEFSVETLAGIITPSIKDDGDVNVKMSKPVLGDKYSDFKIDDKTFEINLISMGNPHCVIFVDDGSDLLELAKTYGPKIESHELFPEKTNVEFAKVISKSEINLVVYERACGITLACGTGACATIVAGILNNLTENKVKINLPGGALTVEWQGSKDNQDCHVFMSGSAEYSFFAEYIL